MNIKSIITTTALYAIPLGILLNFAIPVFLSGDQVYLGDDSVSLVMFCLVFITYIFMLRHYFRKYTNNIPDLLHLFILIPLFSFFVALCLGIGHYINATFIDPDWASKSLELLHQKWVSNNYSKEEIAGQIEWTDTFHNPWKWGLVYVAFFSTLYSIAGTIVGTVLYLRYHLFQHSQTTNTSFQ